MLKYYMTYVYVRHMVYMCIMNIPAIIYVGALVFVTTLLYHSFRRTELGLTSCDHSQDVAVRCKGMNSAFVY